MRQTTDPPTWHRVVPLAAAVVACAIVAVGIDGHADLPATRFLPWLAMPLAVVWLAVSAWVWRHPGTPWTLILAVSVLLRVLAAAEPPGLSSDIYRYAWDGHVSRSGVNPYAWPPDDVHVAALADTRIQPAINRPAARTVYPPGAQTLFAVLPYDVDLVRAAMITAELFGLILMVMLLGRLGQDPARVILWAWSPLAIYEVGNGGHLEAALLPVLVGLALALRAGHLRLAGGLAGWAVALKLYPLALVPALVARLPRRRAALIATAAALVVAVSYLVWGWSVGARVIGFLPQYVGVAEDHNIGMRRLIDGLVAVVAAGALDPVQARVAAFVACGFIWLGVAIGLQRARPPSGLEVSSLGQA